METFGLQIELGNDAMSTAEHVAIELEAVAEKIRTGHDEGRILDANGNTVGRFGFDLGLLLPERGTVELREETELDHAFKVATYNAAKCVVDRQPEQAAQWARTAREISLAIDPSVQVAQLELEDGDTLIVHSKQTFTPEHAANIIDQIKERVDKDVTVLFFDRGLALAGVVKKAT